MIRISIIVHDLVTRVTFLVKGLRHNSKSRSAFSLVVKETYKEYNSVFYSTLTPNLYKGRERSKGISH